MKRVGTVLAMLLVGSAASIGAQPPAAPEPPSPERHMNVTVLRGPSGETRTSMLLPGGGDFDFLTMPMAVGGDPVPGAPYSADAVTEVVQMLADGNRIVRQSTAALFRDGKGRTRREHGVAVLGNFVGGDAGRNRIQIHDPEAGAMFLLDPARRRAHRLPAPRVHLSRRDLGDAPIVETFEMADRPGRQRRTTVIRRQARTDGGQVEKLGTRTIEGVEAQGTRSTVVIPAGQIGNEQPIHIVSERWYSAELKLLVMSRQSDPRFGETTYRLTNLVRAEPAPELFQVPADYRIVDTLEGLGDRMRLQRKRE